MSNSAPTSPHHGADARQDSSFAAPPPQRRAKSELLMSQSVVVNSTNGGEGGSTLRRLVVGKVTRRKQAVKTGLLARLFFPHYTTHHDEHGVSTKPGKRPSVLKVRPGAAPLKPGSAVVCPTPQAGDKPGEVGGEDEDDEEEMTLSKRIAGFLQSHPVQSFFLILLMLDVVFVIGEIIVLTFVSIHVEYPQPPHHHSHGHHSSGYVVPSHCTNTTLSKFQIDDANKGHDHGHATEYWIVQPPDCPIGVYQGLSHSLHQTEKAFAWCSRIIVWIFLLELLTLLACLRLEFITNPFYVVDFIIIVVTVVLDAYFWSQHEEEPAVGLIILVRCWRFARILHGVGMSVHEVDEIELHEEHCEEEGEGGGTAAAAAAGGGDASPEGTAIPEVTTTAADEENEPYTA